ncbi:MFS transporter, partial [Bacillus velezensis]
DHYESHTSIFTVALGFGLLAGSVIGTMIAKKVKPHHLMSIPILAAGLLIFVLGYTDKLWI